MWSGLNAICKRRLIERYLLYNYLICSLPWSNALHISSTSMQAQTHVTIRTHSPHTKVCGLLHLWTTSRYQCTATWARIHLRPCTVATGSESFEWINLRVKSHLLNLCKSLGEGHHAQTNGYPTRRSQLQRTSLKHRFLFLTLPANF